MSNLTVFGGRPAILVATVNSPSQGNCLCEDGGSSLGLEVGSVSRWERRQDNEIRTSTDMVETIEKTIRVSRVCVVLS